MNPVGEPPEVDVIGLGPPVEPRPRRWRPDLLAPVGLALLLGALLGYLAGSRSAGAVVAGDRVASATVEPAVTPPGSGAPEGPPVVATPHRCAVQVGKRMQLGMEVGNQSGGVVTLRGIRAGLPLGGLTAIAHTFSSCGHLSPAADTNPYALQPGTTTWLTITFDVRQRCPAPLPVRFILTYTRSGQATTEDVGGFDDLGDAPWTGCASPTPTATPR